MDLGHKRGSRTWLKWAIKAQDGLGKHGPMIRNPKVDANSGPRLLNSISALLNVPPHTRPLRSSSKRNVGSLLHCVVSTCSVTIAARWGTKLMFHYVVIFPSPDGSARFPDCTRPLVVVLEIRISGRWTWLFPHRDLMPASAPSLPRLDSPFSFSPGTSETVAVWQTRQGTIHKLRFTYASNPAPASKKYTRRTWPGAPNTNIRRPCVHPSTARKSWITCHGAYFSSWLPVEWCTTDYPANLYNIRCGWKIGHKSRRLTSQPRCFWQNFFRIASNGAGASIGAVLRHKVEKWRMVRCIDDAVRADADADADRLTSLEP